MKNELNIRWHSRAGQGAITAAHFLAEALSQMNHEVLSFPDFGAEKRGAPVVVFNRMAPTGEFISDPAQPRSLDIVILLDSTISGAELTAEEIVEGLKPDGILIINTTQKSPTTFQKIHPGKIYHVPATHIALETVGQNVPNVAMVGTLTKILDLDLQKIREILQQDLGKAFPEKIVEKNLIGFDRGAKELVAYSCES